MLTLACRSIYELWGKGSSIKELKESVDKYPHVLKEPYMREDTTFKFTLDTFNKSLPKKIKVARINVSGCVS